MERGDKRYLCCPWQKGDVLPSPPGSSLIPISPAIFRTRGSASTASRCFRSWSGSGVNRRNARARSPGSHTTVTWLSEAVDRNREHGMQGAPGLKLDSKTFGRGRRSPVASMYQKKWRRGNSPIGQVHHPRIWISGSRKLSRDFGAVQIPHRQWYHLRILYIGLENISSFEVFVVVEDERRVWHDAKAYHLYSIVITSPDRILRRQALRFLGALERAGSSDAAWAIHRIQNSK